MIPKSNPFVLSLLIFLLATLTFGRYLNNDRTSMSRVETAQQEKEPVMKKLFAEKDAAYPPREILLRVFKKEGVLELWARANARADYILVKEYDVCYMSGDLGPKRKEGDLQVPEGFYHIERFNPHSSYYLSLGLNYPNQSDRILSDKQRPGGDIFIHGSCASIGCVAITDDKIKELYIVALKARERGQKKIPVHIFPARLSDKGLSELEKKYQGRPDLIAFWQNLKQGYDAFEKSHRPREFSVNENGRYVF